MGYFNVVTFKVEESALNYLLLLVESPGSKYSHFLLQPKMFCDVVIPTALIIRLCNLKYEGACKLLVTSFSHIEYWMKFD